VPTFLPREAGEDNGCDVGMVDPSVNSSYSCTKSALRLHNMRVGSELPAE